MYLLEFYSSEAVKVCSTVLEGAVTVGRSSDNDVSLEDTSISRHHASFEVDLADGENVVLRDRGSTNGVVINGQRIKDRAVRITPQDQIQIGLFHVVLIEESDTEAFQSAEDRTMFLDSFVTYWDSLTVERLRVLYELAREDLPQEERALVEITARTIGACLRFDTLCVILENEDGSESTHSWAEGSRLESCPASLNRAVVQHCQEEGEVVVAGRDRLDTPCTVGAELRVPFLASIVCLPLTSSTTERLGAIYLQSDGGVCYDSEDLKFLALVARSVATSIERERTRADLIRAKEAAEASNRAKSEFLANMSHELRTPLHGVLSFAGIGIKKYATARPEAVLGYFEKIRQSGTVLLDLVNDLLDLAKLESGKTDFDFRPTDLARSVSGVVDEFGPLVSGRDLTVRYAEPGLDARPDVDAARFKQVIRNLLANAVKFSPERGIIEVRLRRREGSILFSVADQGPGIPEEELEAVFDKFVQSSKTKTGAGGTGLGLAICREIVAAHDGRIWAENRAQGGATFFVEISAGDDPPGPLGQELGDVVADLELGVRA